MNLSDILPYLQGAGAASEPQQPTPMVNPTLAAQDTTASPAQGVVPGGPTLTEGRLPTWAEVPGNYISNLAPQTVDLSKALGGAAMDYTMQGGLGGMAAKRYASGTWRDGINKAIDDFDAVKTAVINEPSRLAKTYLTSQGLKEHLSYNPVGATIDIASGFFPGSAAGREAMAVAANRGAGPLTEALAGRMIKPPPVQGMLEQDIARIVEQQHPNSGMLPHEIGNPQWFDPLQEPTAPDTMGRVMQGQDRQVFGGSSPGYDPLQEPSPVTVGNWLHEQSVNKAIDPGGRSNILEVLNPQLFDPLKEPPAPGTIGRVLQEQDRVLDEWGPRSPNMHAGNFSPLREPVPADTMQAHLAMQDMGPAHGRSFGGALDDPRFFDPLKEPTAGDTMGRILQEQDALVAEGGLGRINRQNADASMDPLQPWQFDKLPEPGPLTLERDMGVMQPLRGTPSEATLTRNMDKTRIGDRIDELQSLRADATNKFDRAYYDARVRELQDEIRTPDWTEGNSGPERFVRTNHPSEDRFPFRRSRVTDPHPDEVGMNAPGNKPGHWTQTQDGKRWDWSEERTPDAPGSDTIRAEAGSQAVGHEGHWTPGDDGGRTGDRHWRWQQDTDNTVSTPPIRPPLAPLDPQLMFPGGNVWPPPQVPGAVEPTTAEVFMKKINELRDWGVREQQPNRANNIEQQAFDARAANRRAVPEPSLLSPSLGVPNPAFHPAAGFDPFAPRPGPSQFARKPEGLLADGSNPFDPKGSRLAPPKGLLDEGPSPDQMQMFGMQKGLDPYSKAGRASFKAEAPKQPWNTFKSKKIDDKQNANQAFKVFYEDDTGQPYFTKTTSNFGNAKFEVAAMNAGEILGVDTLPAVMTGDKTFVSPWIDGPILRDNPNLAKEIMLRMEPAVRDRKVLFEFLIADSDKHPSNWILDEAGGRITGIDYGAALRGDHRAMLHPNPGNVNAFYRLVNEYHPRTAPLDKQVLADMLSKEAQVIEHFRTEGGVGHCDLDALHDRFGLLNDLSKMDNPTYQDLKNIIDSP